MNSSNMEKVLKNFKIQILLTLLFSLFLFSSCSPSNDSSNIVEPIKYDEVISEPELVVDQEEIKIETKEEEIFENKNEDIEQIQEEEEKEELEAIEEEIIITDDTNSINEVSVANWNLQVFGKKKSSNESLLDFYVDIIDEYDIIFIQEIRDASRTAFPKLCDKLPEYNCNISSRAGRTSSKEQIGIIFKKGIELVEMNDFNPDDELKDRWERPPVQVEFKIENYTLNIYNIHIKPDDVKNELAYLEEIVEDNGNTLLLGDFNADCRYYSNEKEKEFDSWNWIITDDEDTTVSATDCAYDRIIINQDLTNEFINYGIYKEGIIKEISDHYLVWVSFRLDG